MKHSVVRIFFYLFLFFLSNQGYAQFLGGEGDGYSNLRLSNAVCVANNVNPFSGGQADGHANLRLSNTVCVVSNVNPFSGGQADGHSNLRLANTVCAVINTNPFSGGQADGHSNLRLANIVCPVINANPFSGGLADGQSHLRFTNVTPSECLGIVLPVELLDFDAECANGLVKIIWTTASEFNNDYFTVEHSKDAVNFQKVAIVKSAGNSNNPINYYLNDKSPFNGTAYYRLKQTDYDGNSKYSEIISVNCINEKGGDIKVYPNPVYNELTIEIAGNSETINFEIINALGIVVHKGFLYEKLTIQTTDFASGIYLLKFELLPTSKTAGRTFENKKVIKW